MKKHIKDEKLKKVIYSAVSLALCCTALFSFWMSNKNNNKVEIPDVTENATATEENTENEQVNNPVTNVADERTVPETEMMTKQSKYFAMPLENGITKGYSNGEIVKNATTDDWRTHNGVDLKGTTGDPVKSINDGVVKDVYDDALWGTVVVVDHYDGLIAEYRGLGKGSTAAVGQEVKINEKIGNLSEVPIEKKDGVHLHLEIYKDGKAVPPTDYIGKNL